MKTLKPKDIAAAITGVAMIIGAVAGVAMVGQDSTKVTVVQSPTPAEVANLIDPTTTAVPQLTLETEPEIVLQALPDRPQAQVTTQYPMAEDDEFETDDNHDDDEDDDDDEHGEDDDD